MRCAFSRFVLSDSFNAIVSEGFFGFFEATPFQISYCSAIGGSGHDGVKSVAYHSSGEYALALETVNTGSSLTNMNNVNLEDQEDQNKDITQMTRKVTLQLSLCDN